MKNHVPCTSHANQISNTLSLREIGVMEQKLVSIADGKAKVIAVLTVPTDEFMRCVSDVWNLAAQSGSVTIGDDNTVIKRATLAQSKDKGLDAQGASMGHKEA